MLNRVHLNMTAVFLMIGMGICIRSSILNGADIQNNSNYKSWILDLDKSTVGQPKTDREKVAISTLIAGGDTELESLVDAYRRNIDDTKNIRIYIIEILDGINTPKSRQILLDIATDRNGLGSIYSWHAAMAYMRRVKDKKEIATLLESPNLSPVHGEILLTLKGVDVDDKLLKTLNPWLMGSSFYFRRDSLSILAADPSPEKADDKLRAILQSMRTIEQLQIPLGDSTAKVYDRYVYDRPGTYADVLFEAATNALIQAKTSKQFFAEQTDSLSGTPRFWAMTARANRGDASVHAELKTIVSDPNLFPRMRLRQLGVQAFSKIGTLIDIPWLKQIADSDPYRIHLYLSSSRMFEWVDQTMVNNTGPRAPMLPEEEITPRSMSVLYPIRSAAQEAIKAIEVKSAKTMSVPLGEKGKSP